MAGETVIYRVLATRTRTITEHAVFKVTNRNEAYLDKDCWEGVALVDKWVEDNEKCSPIIIAHTEKIG